MDSLKSLTIFQQQHVHSTMLYTHPWMVELYIFYINKGKRYWVKTKAKKIVLSDMKKIFCCCSLAQSCSPGFPILHYLSEFAQTHVHWVNDAIQSSHPLSSPSPPALNLSQHQGLFQWVRILSYFQWVTKNKYLVTYKIMFKEVHMTLYK